MRYTTFVLLTLQYYHAKLRKACFSLFGEIEQRLSNESPEHDETSTPTDSPLNEPGGATDAAVSNAIPDGIVAQADTAAHPDTVDTSLDHAPGPQLAPDLEPESNFTALLDTIAADRPDWKLSVEATQVEGCAVAGLEIHLSNNAEEKIIIKPTPVADMVEPRYIAIHMQSPNPPVWIAGGLDANEPVSLDTALGKVNSHIKLG